MPAANTAHAYGGVAKTLHWLTVLLIFALLPLGMAANNAPIEPAEALAQKVWLFSLHKTLGVTLFFTALLRVLWALSQPKPHLLHPDRKMESWAAETVHFILYASILLVPLAGWIEHAAAEGFAPIWWPIGQNLPFVPKSEALAHTAASVHIILVRLMVASLLLHIAGALKHHIIDRDDTLRRMLPGSTSTTPPETPHRPALPALTAVAAFAGALMLGAFLGGFTPHQDATRPETAELAQVASGWEVQKGSLAITVVQFGNEVSGSFADWTAAIEFNETPVDGKHGAVTATIAIGSLTLGSVTAQALGPEYFDAGQFPTATFTADILPFTDGGYLAKGSLTLKGAAVPVEMPFFLGIDGNAAEMQGMVTLKRLDFGIGGPGPEVGPDVVIEIDLTATRAGS